MAKDIIGEIIMEMKDKKRTEVLTTLRLRREAIEADLQRCIDETVYAQDITNYVGVAYEGEEPRIKYVRR